MPVSRTTLPQTRSTRKTATLVVRATRNSSRPYELVTSKWRIGYAPINRHAGPYEPAGIKQVRIPNE